MQSATATIPFWIDSTSFPRFAKLSADERVDVLVIGAGITGLTAAYLLTAAGLSSTGRDGKWWSRFSTVPRLR